MIEGIDEREALIEETLRLSVLRRDRMMERAKPGEQRCRFSRRRLVHSVHLLLRTHTGSNREQTCERGQESLHLKTPPVGLLVDLEHCEESFLRNLDAPDALHAL